MAIAGIRNLGFTNTKTQNAMRGANQENFNPIVNGRMLRPPLRHIYLYSVAKREFGPLHHLLFPRLILRGCAPGERWTRCAVIADPVTQASPDQERGGTRVDEEDAWRASIDLLSPNNPTDDPYFNNAGSLPSYFSTSTNCDYISQGVWPSLNAEPTEEEISRAEKARNDRYRAITQKAIQLESKSVKSLNEYLETTPDVHTAMDVLGLQAGWHKAQEVRMECPNCGDTIKSGIAFHQSRAGILCIIDPDRALKAGAINRDIYNELTGSDEAPSEVRRGVGRPRKDETL